jgi:malate synthase
MPTPHQLRRQRDDVVFTAADLLVVHPGTRTEAGLRRNVNVGILYLEAWLAGNGCVPLYHLMEDAATAEISRTQIWQWLHHGAALDDGRTLTRDLFTAVLAEEMHAIRHQVGPDRFGSGRFQQARDLFARLSTSEELEDFLTLPAYELL